MGVFFLFFIVYALAFGFISQAIWSRKGGSPGAGFALGFFLGFLGLIYVAVARPSQTTLQTAPPMPRAPAPSAPTAPAVPPPLGAPPANTGAARPPVSPPPGPGVVRECPFCKEEIRRDASVCPHCRRESPAWDYRDGRWWTDSGDGEKWLDEPSRRWRDADEEPDESAGRAAPWPQPMPVVDATLKFLYSAGPYRLGYSAKGATTSFNIWDENFAVVSRFPFTAAGWEDAFHAFEAMGEMPHVYRS